MPSTSTSQPPPALDRTAAPTALRPVLLFSFLNSISTGLLTSGVFFVTASAFRFSAVENLSLGLLIGVTYVLGARFAGPVQRFVARLLPRSSSRGRLAVLLLPMAGICALAASIAANDPEAPQWKRWALWLAVTAYSPMSGMLWPMVESFVSGGRSGSKLLSAIGHWNVVWSSALVVAYWGMSPLLERHAPALLLLLALVHLASAISLIRFEPEPAPHLEGEHEPHPPSFAQLLVVFRYLLPVAYLCSSALGPVLPAMMRSIGVREAWQPMLASSWLLPRALMFFALHRWGGWHGRWGMPIAGIVLLAVGFGGAVLSPLLGRTEAAWTAMGCGLFVFGTGMAVVYAGAIYYAMEVGRAHIDAGGTHESLIGLGYAGGPALGLLATALVETGLTGALAFEVIEAVLVGGVTIFVGAAAIQRALAGRTDGISEPRPSRNP